MLLPFFIAEVQGLAVYAQIEADIGHYARAHNLAEMHRVCVEVVKMILARVSLPLELPMLPLVEVPNQR
jgi:hypothetical protein